AKCRSAMSAGRVLVRRRDGLSRCRAPPAEGPHDFPFGGAAPNAAASTVTPACPDNAANSDSKYRLRPPGLEENHSEPVISILIRALAVAVDESAARGRSRGRSDGDAPSPGRR